MKSIDFVSHNDNTSYTFHSTQKIEQFNIVITLQKLYI
jgi:hypothetical protein